VAMDNFSGVNIPFAFVVCIFGMQEQHETSELVLSISMHWLGRTARLLGSLLQEESSTRLDPSSRQGFEGAQV
jgi:hypothetical protein